MRINNITNNINRQAFSGTFIYNKKESEKLMKRLSFLERCSIEFGLGQLEDFIVNETPKDREYEVSLKTDINVQYVASRKNEEVYSNTRSYAVDVFDKTANKYYEDELVEYSSTDTLELNRSTDVWVYRPDEPVSNSEKGSILRGFDSIMEKIKKEL